MPIHLIGTTPGGGAAGIVASQVLGLVAFRVGKPVILLEVSADPSRSRGRARLLPALPVLDAEATAVLSQITSSATVIVAVENATATTLAPILPLADSTLVSATRLGSDLAQATGLYRDLSALMARGPAGRIIQPWLLPAGWACTKSPGTRLRGWQRRLEEVSGEDEERLRCLPLVLPWHEPGGLRMASTDRLHAVGRRLLEQLAAIAAGQRPERPADGLAGGDPWPDRPVPNTLPPITRMPGSCLRLVHTVTP